MVALPLVIVTLLAGPWPVAAIAAEPPACAPASLGTVACIGERLCRCRLERGGSMTNRQPGFGWDCGALRPSCHRPPALPERSGWQPGDLDIILPLDDHPRLRRTVRPAD